MLAPALLFILTLLFPVPWISTVHAQTTNATCLPAYSWMTNSMGQNPCLVTAWLYFPCYGTGGSRVTALPTGYQYIGPLKPTDSTSCECNTIVYSLLAACSVCQNGGGGIQTWPVYSTNCTNSYNENYPNTIPGATAVPEWAFLNMLSNGTFDVNGAKSVAAQELSDVTATTDTSSTSTLSSISHTSESASSTIPTPDSTGTPSESLAPTSSPATEHSNRNVGAIVGGVVGAVVGVLLVGALVFYIVRLRHRKRMRRDQGPANLHTTEVRELLPGSIAPSYHVPTLQSDTGSAIVGFYDPNDPRTYPAPMSPAIGYTGLPQVMS